MTSKGWDLPASAAAGIDQTIHSVATAQPTCHPSSLGSCDRRHNLPFEYPSFFLDVVRGTLRFGGEKIGGAVVLRLRPALGRDNFQNGQPGPNRWNQIKTAQAACGGWESPAALPHIQPGRWMANPGGCAACTAGDPDGTRTDGPQAADLHWAAHSTSPIGSLRSSAVRRCDNYHGIVELDCTPRSSLRRPNTVRSIRSCNPRADIAFDHC